MSASSTRTTPAGRAAETFTEARSRISGAMSAATIRAPHSCASRIAVVPTPQPDVQDPLARSDGRELEQAVGGGATATIDDAFAQHRKERVRVQLLHLLAGQRLHGCHFHQIQENS
jgi:hypothetical protein